MNIIRKSKQHAGQALVEYAVTLILVILVVFVMVAAIGPQVVRFYDSAVHSFP